jgi:hypothetical protein
VGAEVVDGRWFVVGGSGLKFGGVCEPGIDYLYDCLVCLMSIDEHGQTSESGKSGRVEWSEHEAMSANWGDLQVMTKLELMSQRLNLHLRPAMSAVVAPTLRRTCKFIRRMESVELWEKILHTRLAAVAVFLPNMDEHY